MRNFFKWFSGGAVAAEFHPARVCAECGSRLRVGETRSAAGELWECPNLDCPARVRRWLEHWCAPAVMDVPGGDAAMVAKLTACGLVRDVAELYQLKVKELAALPGVDASAAQFFFDALTASTKRDAWRLLCGLNIPLVGAAEARALMKSFPTVGAVFAAGAAGLMKEAGVSAAVAESVVRWHSDGVNRRLLARLKQLGLNFTAELFLPPAK